MADGVDIDLYSDDIDQNFTQMKVRTIIVIQRYCIPINHYSSCSGILNGNHQQFVIRASLISVLPYVVDKSELFVCCVFFFLLQEGDYVGDEDLYDDVVAAPSSEPHERNENENGSIQPAERSDGNDANGSYLQMGNSFAPNHPGRRHQLYVGNLTWVSRTYYNSVSLIYYNVLSMNNKCSISINCFHFFPLEKQWTTDQDITDAVNSIGVADFQEVKFFENRANGQSKGFCVITLGSESAMRMCLERLSKNELHGQKPIVTLPTKAALAQFESQQKTRPIPPPTNPTRGQTPMQPGPMQNNFPQGPQNHGPPRMMMPNGPSGPGGFRPQHMPPQNMGMPPVNQGPPRMQVAIKNILFDTYFGRRIHVAFNRCTLLMTFYQLHLSP